MQYKYYGCAGGDYKEKNIEFLHNSLQVCAKQLLGARQNIKENGFDSTGGGYTCCFQNTLNAR